MSNKPNVFIGSSSGSADIAEMIAVLLDRVSHPTPWTVAFGLSDTTIETLESKLKESDFGVFVMAKDDLIMIQKEQHRAVRDNVIFELGLFMGQLGRKRCFLVVPKEPTETADSGPRLRLPTDLAGITYATYDATRSDLRAALSIPCALIKSAIKEKGSRSAEGTRFGTWLAEQVEQLGYTDGDYAMILADHLKNDPDYEKFFRFSDKDKFLEFPPGTTRKVLTNACEIANHNISKRTDNTVIVRRRA